MLRDATALIPLLLAAVRPPWLDFVHRHSPTPEKYLLETMGGGVALLDFDGDGLLDIFFVNGAPLPSLRRGVEHSNRLYRQNRDHSFTDVTARSGLGQVGEAVYGMGAAAGDFDGDGRTDLYVTGYPRAALFRNNGDGTFTDVTARAGAGAAGWSASAGFFDYDNDGRPDLFVTRYLDWDLRRHIRCGAADPAYCNPDRFPPVTNVLYRNEGGGRFRDVSEASGIAAHRGKGLGVALSDYDGDGRADIFVANDGMAQFLFHNNGDGTFRERGLEAGLAFSDEGRPFAGMGIAVGDYDNDGRADVAISNLAGEIYALYHNEGGGLLRQASLAAGLGRLTARSSGWGLGWADFDNDGRRDLFVAQGHVLDNIERIDAVKRYKEPPALLRNTGGGTFVAAPIEGATPMAGRGAALGDLDNDGAMDVVMTALGERPVILRGKPGANHWLSIRLSGAAHARVTVNGQVAECGTGGSYLSSGDSRLHFGLGAAQRARIEIRRPDGKVRILEDAAVDRVITVDLP